ncbi:hypothetical protein CEQ90_12660 [Lewinellaceae bacterium SD302]|nr:hypothetical protein CEQ90_12660 [Lewinellaceae bacterium SD302]
MLLVIGNSVDIYGQSSFLESDIDQKKLSEVDSLLLFSNYDQALLILDSLVNVLEDENALEEDRGLRWRSKRAYVLEELGDHSLAVEEMLLLEELTEQRGLYDLQLENTIQLALLYEYTELPEQAVKQLNAACRILKRHSDLEIYTAWFAVRKSSYQRIFEDGDSSRYFAELALEYARKYNQPRHLRDAHMLLSTDIVGLPLEEKIYHRRASSVIARQFKDLTAVAYNLSVIGNLYLLSGRPDYAMRYIDSALHFTHQNEAEILFKDDLYSSAYATKSDAFQAMGLPDSSRLYLIRAYELKLTAEQKKNQKEIAELDARFRIRSGEREIEQQRLIIESERSWSSLFQMLLAALLILILGILYFYYRLRQANAETRAQNLRVASKNRELLDSLDQQSLLQSEVHHRVKNNLQVIISLLDLQQESIEDETVRDKLNIMSSRIFSMAAVHDILYQQNDVQRIALEVYVASLFEQVKELRTQGKEPQLELSAGDVSLNLTTCMPVGIILTELLTNSMKHGTRQEGKLKIWIVFREVSERGIALNYRDNGPGFQNGKLEGRIGGLGDYLLRSMVHQLKGSIRSFNDGGANVEIRLERKV